MNSSTKEYWGCVWIEIKKPKEHIPAMIVGFLLGLLAWEVLFK